jgi:hypothetical protein
MADNEETAGIVQKEITEVPRNHPMEDILDIEEGTTMVPAVKRSSELVVSGQYDNKDDEIDAQYQEVYDLSLEAFEQQSQEAELVEGKYKARNGEIAAQYLNIALNAAKEKGTLKGNKDKLSLAAEKVTKSGGTTNNNLIVGDRNDILKTLMGKDDAPEPIDITPEPADNNETE